MFSNDAIRSFYFRKSFNSLPWTQFTIVKVYSCTSVCIYISELADRFGQNESLKHRFQTRGTFRL